MLTVEKIEGKIVTVENDSGSFNADASLFVGEIREGDVVVKMQDGRFARDVKATENRRKAILKLQNSLWKEG
ncbi:MAG: DUF3006 domain-containing protein [Oscillospiraceae bacterium]|nr:DUF3006 domain-containing protein [Oscillospiraceae bacterium]